MTGYIVYRCAKIGWMQSPQNEVAVSHHATARAAYEEACRLKQNDPHHSYVVGGA